MLRLFKRKPKAERKPMIIEHQSQAVSTPKTREEKLRRAAAVYSQASAQTLVEAGIGAKLSDWYISPRVLGVGIRLETSADFDKAMKLAEKVAYNAGAVEVLAQRLGRFIYFQFELPEKAWLPVHQEGDMIGLGPRNTKEEFSFMDAPHALIAGITDSGKTVLAESILVSLANKLSHEELGVVIIDPHGEFEVFDNWAYLEYKIGRSDEEIARLATLMERELDRRIQNNLRNEKRILIMVDEAEKALRDNDTRRRLSYIAKEARKFNMNLLIITQEPDNENLEGIFGELDNRYIGKVADAQKSGQFGAGLNLHKLTSRGDFRHLVKGKDSRFTAAMVPDEVKARLDTKEVPDIPDDEDLLEPVEIVQPKPPHGQVITATPEAVDYYLRHGPDNVTIRQAREALGLKRTGHYVNRDFARTLQILQAEREVQE